MSTNIYLISDLHLGHKNIIKFAGEYRKGSTIEEHDQWIIDTWNTTVKKSSLVWVLGDVAFTPEGFEKCRFLRGTKHLIMGNHDQWNISAYLQYFHVIRPSPWAYKGYWLSHAPIHPDELRGRKNIHGHVHQNTIPDDRYINVSVEAYGRPVSLDQIIEERGK